MKTIGLILFSISSVFFVSSCGNANEYEKSYQENDKQKAEDSILSGNYDRAIEYLNSYLLTNSTDYSAQSMLANAYMLKAGISITDIIINITNNISNSKGNLYALIASFPVGDVYSISAINTAITTLNTNIPAAALSSSQELQLAIANGGLAFLTINKYLLYDTNGNITASSITSLGASGDATIIYNALVNVQSQMINLGITAGNSTGYGTLLSEINSITSSPGVDGPSKLLNYLNLNK